MAAVLTVALVIRVAYLGEVQLFRDEAASWLLASYPPSTLIDRTAHEAYPPLYALVLKGWMFALGDGEVSLRMLSAVAGFVVVLIGWRWAHEAVGSRPGVFAAAALAISPLAVANARDARMYAIESAFAAAAWWLSWRIAGRDRSWAAARLELALLALTVAGEVWTLYLGLSVAALQALFAAVVLVVYRRRAAAAALGAIALGTGTLLVWFPALATAATREGFWTTQPSVVALLETLGYTSVGWGAVATLLAPLPIALWIVGVAALHRGRFPLVAPRSSERAQARVLALSLALGAGHIPLVWVVSQLRPVYDSRYLGAAIVPCALGVAIGIEYLLRRLAPLAGMRTAGRVVSIAAGVVCLVALSPVGKATAYLRDVAPTREVLAIIATRMRPGDVVLAVDPRSYFTVAYWVGRHSAGQISLPGPIYSYDSGRNPWYAGGPLLPTESVVAQEALDANGPHRSLAGLHDGGHIWLVALANGTNEDLNFPPLRDGTFTEVGRVVVQPAGEAGQIRELVVAAGP
jgi:hypothetical protein